MERVDKIDIFTLIILLKNRINGPNHHYTFTLAPPGASWLEISSIFCTPSKIYQIREMVCNGSAFGLKRPY